MAQSAQIQKLAPKHHHLIDLLVAFPTSSNKEMARRLGVSEAWVSTIKHSQVFKQALRQRQDQVHEGVVSGIAEKTLGLGEMLLDRMMELVPYETDLETLNDMSDNILDKCGYGTKGERPGITINNNQLVQSAVPADVIRQEQATIGVYGNGVESEERALPSPSPDAPGEGS